jgi:transketolase
MHPFLVPQQIIARLRPAAEHPGPAQSRALRRLAAIHRLHTLAGLRAANHGWLGACFSAMEILAVLHHAVLGDPLLPLPERHSLVLSKGHAAMAQYAVLAGMGALPLDSVLTYKARGGLPAHSDRSIPGVDADSGSLGMGLSKGIGIAMAHRHAGRPFRSYVLLGDGELQEGQVFEALLTLKQWGVTNCVPIIDRNRLQSDSQTCDIKDADDWAMVLHGIGLDVLVCDGHDPDDLLRVFAMAGQAARPTVILAETVKGAGTTVTAMSRQVARRQGIWHGAIPDDAVARTMERELVAAVDDPELTSAWHAGRSELEPSFPADPGPVVSVPQIDLAASSTEDGWGAALADLLPENPDVFVFDADLEKTCRLRAVAQACPDRFLEVGISEQDMVSIAAGLGLAGKICVVNTLAAFLRRAFDQIQAAAVEGAPLIVAGHYAGIDYFSDGKSHQALNDVAMMRAIPGQRVFEPLTAGEAKDILNFLIEEFRSDLRGGKPCRPAYVRLHRATPGSSLALPLPFAPGRPYLLATSPGTVRPPRLFVTSPHLAATALEARSLLAVDDIDLEVIALSTYGMPIGRCGT